MANPRGFLDFKRVDLKKIAPLERIKSYKEFAFLNDKKTQQEQASRCMDCGVAFCQTGVLEQGRDIGCPLKNLIPEWNDNIYKSEWQQAYERLSLTNPFPEFTGRVCPAPCEDSCVCAINTQSVTIKNNELAIIENAFEQKWVRTNTPKTYNGKKVAIVGSGPAGLACANELNSLGYKVVVFERSDRIGGLLMYGIPDMKLEKKVIERRVKLMKQSGVEFRVKENIDSKAKANKILKEFDAVVLATGASKAIDLDIEGRGLQGVMFAVDFLTQNTKTLLDTGKGGTLAQDKDVLIIGSGDTSVDCVAVATRQGAKSITRFERSPKKPLKRVSDNPWPLKADIFTTDYGLEEAIAKYNQDPRKYQKMTKKFIGKNGKLEGVLAVDLKQVKENGRLVNIEIPNSEKFYKADLVLLAIGFSGCENEIKENFAIELNSKNNIKERNFQSSREKVFACGDARIGQSLVVWAIKDGVECALEVHRSLFNLYS
ncbi:glutamate synthase subunit beta [Campylobacter sp. MIT 21-1685]|uniref:glutamate synthase subunit beta n=1 Tax=unclassified Campylobacter TaxID=2593542 RepID=UPI00224AE836|nr:MULTISPECIES: glutamate synthase subunit beta [unclassified Campylobacter]MCX2683712.1 glutamate synthase subunit beta [Campylobacter sp. MIT 21-1684]MCX2751997.1 glutamate synthase subunit beta [Campylobacter sp. MIT 21-1682]MCX2808196.1 glutamate synthase subunit beta [Campylobacter sp. MIT 21-1685]